MSDFGPRPMTREEAFLKALNGSVVFARFYLRVERELIWDLTKPLMFERFLNPASGGGDVLQFTRIKNLTHPPQN